MFKQVMVMMYRAAVSADEAALPATNGRMRFLEVIECFFRPEDLAAASGRSLLAPKRGRCSVACQMPCLLRTCSNCVALLNHCWFCLWPFPTPYNRIRIKWIIQIQMGCVWFTSIKMNLVSASVCYLVDWIIHRFQFSAAQDLTNPLSKRRGNEFNYRPFIEIIT